MRFIRGFVAGTLLLLIFCGVMVVRQFVLNDDQHIEKRESFFLLVKKGLSEESEQAYQSLMLQLQEMSDKTLVEDLQRAAMLVDTTKVQTDNQIWRYYWALNGELEKRAEIRLGKVLEKAETR